VGIGEAAWGQVCRDALMPPPGQWFAMASSAGNRFRRRPWPTPAEVGGPALRELTFHQRARALESARPKKLSEVKEEFLRAVLLHRRDKERCN